jgi:hypothetical protein
VSTTVDSKAPNKESRVAGEYSRDCDAEGKSVGNCEDDETVAAATVVVDVVDDSVLVVVVIVDVIVAVLVVLLGVPLVAGMCAPSDAVVVDVVAIVADGNDEEITDEVEFDFEVVDDEVDEDDADDEEVLLLRFVMLRRAMEPLGVDSIRLSCPLLCCESVGFLANASAPFSQCTSSCPSSSWLNPIASTTSSSMGLMRANQEGN